MKKSSMTTHKTIKLSSLGKIINAKLIAYAIGILVCVEAAMLFLCMGISLFYNEHTYTSFLYSAIINLVIGILLVAYGRGANTWMTRKDGYFIVTVTWLIFTLLGMLPFLFSGVIPSVTDAFFETISGFTTTGTTILDRIEDVPHSLLFWRSLTQWIGGLGIMCFTIALLPIFGGGNLQLFSAEATGVTHEKIHPKISMNTKIIWVTYISLTIVCGFLLMIEGMTPFDAICHSLTTLSTGGYSTKQASVAYWDSACIDYTIAFFMMLASLNFALLIGAINGKVDKLLKDSETKWFMVSVAVLTLIIWLALSIQSGYDYDTALRKAFFQVVTIHSSCGFSTDDYNLWPRFTWMFLLFAMLAGGCTGSTAGGMKSMRIMILFHGIRNEFKRLIHPNAVLSVRINKHVISRDVVATVSMFTIFYMVCIFVGCVLMMIFGLDFLEAVSCTISALGNTGPGMGAYGPAFTMSSMPDVVKWIMSFLMLIGRLELFSVLILFSPVFWKEW